VSIDLAQLNVTGSDEIMEHGHGSRALGCRGPLLALEDIITTPAVVPVI